MSPHATGARFTMYLLNLGACGTRRSLRREALTQACCRRQLVVGAAPAGGGAVRWPFAATLPSCGAPDAAARRFMFILDGSVDVHAGAVQRTLVPDDFAYFPPDTAHMCAP